MRTGGLTGDAFSERSISGASRPALLRRLVPIGVVLGSLLISGCQPQEPRFGPGVVARIDGTDLRYADFERFLARVGEEPTSLESAVMAALFLRFLDEEVLHRMAQERRILTRGEPSAYAADALLDELEIEEPTEEQIRAYHQQHAEEFERPARVVLRQMLLGSRELARAAQEALREGLSWQQVALEIAGDPSGSIATELALEELPPELAPEILETPEGSVTPILEQDYGFHLFLIEQRHPEGVVALEEARPEIEARLRQEARELAYQRLLSDAWSEYNVEIARTNLPFVLSDRLAPDERASLANLSP